LLLLDNDMAVIGELMLSSTDSITLSNPLLLVVQKPMGKGRIDVRLVPLLPGIKKGGIVHFTRNKIIAIVDHESIEDDLVFAYKEATTEVVLPKKTIVTPN